MSYIYLYIIGNKTEEKCKICLSVWKKILNFGDDNKFIVSNSKNLFVWLGCIDTTDTVCKR